MSAKTLDTKKTNKPGRLKKRPDFLRVQSSGHKWITRSFIIHVSPQKNQNGIPPLRVGFTVSRKAHKNAVGRNRIKRRLRALATELMPAYAATGYDYVLLARAGALDYAYKDMKRDLLWSLEKLSCLKTV